VTERPELAAFATFVTCMDCH